MSLRERASTAVRQAAALGSLPSDTPDERLRKSALASSFVAALELARLGRAELAQDDAFGPLRLRRIVG